MKLAHLLAAAFALPAFASAADFSGTWKLENDFNGSVSAIYCTVVQSSNTLSGSCRPDLAGMAASTLTGTVAGSTAKWGYDLVFNGKPSRVDYEATLAADGSLTGSLLRNGSASPIKGKRENPAKAKQN